MSSIINIKVTKQEALNAIEAYYKKKSDDLNKLKQHFIKEAMKPKGIKFFEFTFKKKEISLEEANQKWERWVYDFHWYKSPSEEQIDSLYNIILFSKVDFTVTINEHIKELIPFLE